MSLPFSDEEYRLWAEWLSEEYGLHYGPEKREILRGRLEPRRAAMGFDSYEALLFHARFHPERETERARLVAHLTNHESYFLREPGSLAVVRDEILPTLGDAVGPRGTVRALSAACAAGEEAYSLAILGQEAGLAGRLEVTGMDVDEVVLEKARAGRYRTHAFRGTDEAFRARWFTELPGDEWEVRPALRQGVRFVRGNLVDGAWWRSLAPQHLVLCRNVLIYFGEAAVLRAAEALHAVLAREGWLVLAHAETLRNVPVPLELLRRPGALVYRRAEDA